ncbi:dihydrofolate reductase family protein [Mycolicibacterium sp. CBMA 361]|uniref:dihydrofolate reductase family protein n=1 Tax=Mycolicibacterium sp. CBMA 361 TaxID=2606610 RepID=UPI0012DDEAA2|nr:dihydrofolate reductase family protein [Mycolicibacterium sp. CBMA 361]MUM35987.1 deaminase [Mycolicibacterium sp. CBMA 361]
MGLIHLALFATLDLVGQAPGGPDEDPDGFSFGGWQANPDLSWSGSTQLGSDLVAAVRAVRERHDHVKVVGSLDFVQTLLRERLFDRLDLWVHPIVLGVGKKVFDDGAVPSSLTLLEQPVASPRGIVHLRYGLVDGVPATGDMSAPDRGVD